MYFFLLIYRKRKFCAEPMREWLTFHFELRTRSGNFRFFFLFFFSFFLFFQIKARSRLVTLIQATKPVKQQPILCPANSFPSSTKVHDLSSDGRESHSKEKPDKLSFINVTCCRHDHKTHYELNVSKNDLFTDSVNMNIHTSLNKFIFFLPNFIFQKAIYTSCILFVFIFCYMHIKLFVV